LHSSDKEYARRDRPLREKERELDGLQNGIKSCSSMVSSLSQSALWALFASQSKVVHLLIRPPARYTWAFTYETNLREHL